VRSRAGRVATSRWCAHRRHPARRSDAAARDRCAHRGRIRTSHGTRAAVFAVAVAHGRQSRRKPGPAGLIRVMTSHHSTQGEAIVFKRLFSVLALFSVALLAVPARADEYQATIDLFKKAVESREFFKSAYGYAVFPTIGKGGIGVGGAYGKGRVYQHGRYVGDSSMVQLSIGFQLGGQAYSQIIFFEDQRAFKEFTSGQFEFGAEASAVAITLSASAK